MNEVIEGLGKEVSLQLSSFFNYVYVIHEFFKILNFQAIHYFKNH